MSKHWLIRVGPNGRITLPKELLDQVGIRSGDYITLESTPEAILLRPSKNQDTTH